MGQSITELTAAGLLTLGGPMVGAPGDDLDLLCLLSLSWGCACMHRWACETSKGAVCQGRQEGKPKREAFHETCVRRAPLLRLLLLLGRAADDASDA